MENLQEKMERVLNDEKKGRDTALSFLLDLTVELEDVCKEMYGEAGFPTNERSLLIDDRFKNTISLWRKKDDKITFLDLYYRYEEFEGEDDFEDTGFFLKNYSDFNLWGNPLENVKGDLFWKAVRSIVEWLPLFADAIEEKNINRNKLVEKIRKFSEGE